MGKKTSTTTKPTAPAKRAAKSKPATAKVAVPEPNAAMTSGIKSEAAAPRAKPATRRPKKLPYSQEDISLRAYFISERRQAAGVAGDPHQDWIEAERQLASEAVKPGRSKAKKS